MTHINYQKGFVLKRILWLIVLVIILGFFAYKGKQKIHQVIENDHIATSTVGSMEFKTYTSANYFTIEYPASSTINENYKYTLLGPTLELSGVSFSLPASYFENTNLSKGSYIAVENNERICGADLVAGGIHATSTEMINGIPFSKTFAADAGAGNFYQEIVYSAVTPWNRNVCLSARLFLHSTNIGVLRDSDPTVKEFNTIKIQELFDKMVHSIKFISSNQNAITSDWKTYTSSKYKLILNYPQDWKVLEPHNTEIDTVYLQSPRLIKYLENHPGDSAHLPFYDIYIGIHEYQKFAYNTNAFHNVLFNNMHALEGNFEGDGINTKEFIIDKTPYTYVVSVISSADTDIENKILSTIDFTN